MPYICATHELRLQGGRIAKRGELVPEADQWPENIRRSNIRLGWIEEAKGVPTVSAAGTLSTVTPASAAPSSIVAVEAKAPAKRGRKKGL